MGQPTEPVVATTPIPPPIAGLPFGQVRDGMVYLTPSGYQFLQLLWAAIQGGGGLLDIATLSLLDTGPMVGFAESVASGALSSSNPLGPGQPGMMVGLAESVGAGVLAQLVALMGAPRRPYEPIVRFYGALSGIPSAGQELFAIEMTGDEHFPAGLGRNVGKVAIAPTGSVTFPIKVNGAQIGTMNVAAGQTTATWTMTNPYDAASGDLLAFYAPTLVDATLSSPRYTFVGTRS